MRFISFCSSPAVLAIIAVTSANPTCPFIVMPLSSNKSALLNTASLYALKSNGDKTNCLLCFYFLSDLVFYFYLSSCFQYTFFIIRMLSVFFACSISMSLSCRTLLNAFLNSTPHMYTSWFMFRHFCTKIFRANQASLVPILFLKPNWVVSNRILVICINVHE